MRRWITLSFLLVIFTLVVASGAAETEWARVIGPRIWSFPRDHGAHPGYRTEWWYFTGNLTDEAGSRYGYQVTFFRQGIRGKVPDQAGSWDIRDLYLAHFAITDAAKRNFRFTERVARAGPGLAGARTDGMDVWLLNWSARMEGSEISLQAKSPDTELTLKLTPEMFPGIYWPSHCLSLFDYKIPPRLPA